MTDDETLSRIAYHVRRLRGDRTLTEIAIAAQTYPSNVQRIERQESMPKVGMLTRLAESLGVEIHELLLPIPSRGTSGRPSKKISIGG